MERDPTSSTDESKTHSKQTQIDESSIFQTWLDFVEKCSSKSRKITTVNDLILKLEQLLVANNASDCLQNPKSFKKKRRRRLEIEFKDRANIFLNREGKLIFLPNTVTIEQIAEDYMELKKQHKELMLESNKTMKLVQKAAVIIRSEVSQLKYNMSWPPKVSELGPDMERISNLFQHFLSYLLHGLSKPTLKTSSIGQDIIYCAHNGQFITSKHIFLPFTIKSMTGNVELIKIINRFEHGVSYTKLGEVDTAYAIQKISVNSSLIPEEIQPYQQASMVYDNIDRLEETLSGAGTTHRVNGIVIQKAFIRPKFPQNFIDIPKTKQRSIYVEPLELPVYNIGIRPEPPVLRNMNVNLDLNTQEMSSKKNLIWFLCQYFNKENQNTSS